MFAATVYSHFLLHPKLYPFYFRGQLNFTCTAQNFRQLSPSNEKLKQNIPRSDLQKRNSLTSYIFSPAICYYIQVKKLTVSSGSVADRHVVVPECTEVESNGITSTLNFVKIGHLIQKL
jgi:hypothetical protein